MWAPVDSGLPDHPKSLKLAELTSEARAWTRVVELWLWAVNYAQDGDLTRFSDKQVGCAMGYDVNDDRCAHARENLIACEFIDADGHLHDWDEWFGRHLRELERKRKWKRKFSSKKGRRPGRRPVASTETPGSGSVSVDRTGPYRTVPDRTVPDLIGPDRTAKPTSPGPSAPGTRDQGAGVFAQRRADEGFQAFWQTYPKKRSRGRALAAWKKALKERRLPELEHVLTALERLKASEDWRKEAGKYVPYPASWLNADGWEDQVGVSAEPPGETAGQRTERALKSFGFLKEKPA